MNHFWPPATADLEPRKTPGEGSCVGPTFGYAQVFRRTETSMNRDRAESGAWILRVASTALRSVQDIACVTSVAAFVTVAVVAAVAGPLAVGGGVGVETVVPEPLVPATATPAMDGGATTVGTAAAPGLWIRLPRRARFAIDQRVDIRIEYQSPPGEEIRGLTVKMDGARQILPSPLPASGVTLRARSWAKAGSHRIEAAMTWGASGSLATSARVEVIDPVGGKRKARNLIIMLGDGMGIGHRTAARIVRCSVDDGLEGYPVTAAKTGQGASVSRTGAFTDGHAAGTGHGDGARPDGEGGGNKSSGARIGGEAARGGIGDTEGPPDSPDARKRELCPLAMDTLPGTGLVMTYSLDSIVTDSAPGMSCYTTGSKAANGSMGVYPDNTPDPFDNPRIEYLGEYMHRRYGKALGIVTTADVSDATPAAMVAHTSDRGRSTGICDQFLDEGDRSDLRVLMGGGRRWFLPTGTFGSSRDEKGDCELPAELASAWGAPRGRLDPGRDLLADFRAKGFGYVSTASELRAIATGNDGPGKLLGLFAFGNMNVALDKIAKRRDHSRPGVVDDHHAPDQPMLDEMTAAALRVLDRNPAGFVLLVEGAHIDKQSHSMDAERAIWDVLEFDDAVRTARTFAEKVKDTVVIVLADHETSGFGVLGTSGMTRAALEELPADRALSSPDEHPARQRATGVPGAPDFPVYSIAPDGYPKNAAPGRKVFVGFAAGADRFEDWLPQPLPLLDRSQPAEIRAELEAKGYAIDAFHRTPQSARGFFVRGVFPPYEAKSGATDLIRGSAEHTASDVPISSFSSGSDAWRGFVGTIDNTDVFFALVRAAGGGY